MGADALAHGVALLSGAPGSRSARRPRATAGGRGSRAPGCRSVTASWWWRTWCRPGRRCCRAVERVRDLGAVVVAATALLDRSPAVAERFAAAGIEWSPLLTWVDLGSSPSEAGGSMLDRPLRAGRPGPRSDPPVPSAGSTTPGRPVSPSPRPWPWPPPLRTATRPRGSCCCKAVDRAGLRLLHQRPQPQGPRAGRPTPVPPWPSGGGSSSARSGCPGRCDRSRRRGRTPISRTRRAGPSSARGRRPRASRCTRRDVLDRKMTDAVDPLRCRRRAPAALVGRVSGPPDRDRVLAGPSRPAARPAALLLSAPRATTGLSPASAREPARTDAPQ